MAVIKATNQHESTRRSPFNFDEMSRQAEAYLEQVRRQAQAIQDHAQREAAAARPRLEAEIRAAAERELQRRVEDCAATRVNQTLETLLPALEDAVGEIRQARSQWLSRWEGQVLRLAIGIAQKLIRRELRHDAGIPLELLQEALELAAGSPRLRIRLNPADREALGPRVEQVVERLAELASVTILADEQVTPGGCIVETDSGEIDQRFESQIQRIHDELTTNH